MGAKEGIHLDLSLFAKQVGKGEGKITETNMILFNYVINMRS